MRGSDIKNGFLEHLGKTIKDAFIVFSAEGDIFYFNEEAENLLKITPNIKKIFELFTPLTLENFRQSVAVVTQTLNYISTQNSIELYTGDIFNAEIILSFYTKDNEQFILCTFKRKYPDIEAKEVSKVKTQLNNIEELIKNKEIVEVISKVRTSYPFTFLGKEKLRSIIDKFEELFWVRNGEGVYLLVNKNMANTLASHAYQIEGKEENSFLPPYLAEFNWTIDSYLKQTGNCLIIEGLPFKGLSVQSSLQTIEIPLRDAENNVIAVVGITQRKIREGEKEKKKREINSEIIKILPVQFAYFNREEILIHSTDEFCKLFGIDFSETAEYSFRNLPAGLADLIDEFICSPEDEEKFELNGLKLGSNFRKGLYNFQIKKIYGCENQFEGISLLIEETSNELKLRGKMVNAFIQKNPEPVFVYDKDNLKFLDVNNSALSLYGFTRDQFLQMDLTDLYSAEDIQSLLESSEYASKEGEFTGPFKHKKKDGSLIVVELAKINLKYGDKDAYLNIIRNFSEEFDKEKKNQLYKAAFDKTNDLLFITDSAGFIKFTNNAVVNKLGYSETEIKDASFAALTSDDERGKINSSIFQSNMKEPQVINTKMKKHEGETVDAELTVTPILDYKNEVDSFNIIATLKTDGKTAAPAETYDSETISPVFLSSLFHEILTPINAILGFVQELTESIQTKTPEQKEAAKIINQNRASLLHTLNTIAEFTSLQRNEYEINYEEVHITEVIDKLQKEIEEFSGLRGTEFAYGKISSSLKFKTDKLKFMTVLSLLIRMVIRLSKEKKIYLSAYQLDEEYFTVAIRDQHSSVSKYLLDCLNNIFQKEKVEKDFGVSRISINLSKKLLNLLNGRFEVLVKEGNKLDYGFLFPFSFQAEQKKVEKEKTGKPKEKPSGKSAKAEEKHEAQVKTLPLEEGIKWEGEASSDELVIEEFEPEESAAAPEPPSPPKKVIDLGKISCLYIEDQIDSQILFKVQLKDLKDIKFAVSFEEAIPLFKSYRFDLIVIDMNLSGEYNGLDALKMIHQLPGFEKIPIIAVSAYVLPGDKEKFISSGFSDFISKPLFREKMLDSINKIFPSL